MQAQTTGGGSGLDTTGGAAEPETNSANPTLAQAKAATQVTLIQAKEWAKAGEWTHCCRCGHKLCGYVRRSVRVMMVTEFHGNGKQGLEIAGNCPSTGNFRQSASSDARSEDWPCMPSELDDIRRFQHHIKSSMRLVEFVCQEPRNLGSSPMHSEHMGSA